MSKPLSQSFTRDHRAVPIRSLYLLCEAWLSGRMTDAAFVRKVREEQLKIFASDWQSESSETDAVAQSLLDNAQRCVLAVHKAIDGLQKSARTPNDPPIALRAYFFGRHVDSEAIANLDAMLRLDASVKPNREQTPLGNEFDPPT